MNALGVLRGVIVGVAALMFGIAPALGQCQPEWFPGALPEPARGGVSVSA